MTNELAKLQSEMKGEVLPPLLASYLPAQFHLSQVASQLGELEELAPWIEVLSAAEDELMPVGPPMSPITQSFYTAWSLFDFCLPPSHESVGKIVLHLGEAFGMPQSLSRAIRNLLDSHMGFYVQGPRRAGVVTLTDIVTGDTLQAICPAGYRGKKGEIWYARVLPPLRPDEKEFLVLTTPYIMISPGLPEWKAYFDRTLPIEPKEARLAAYREHMKHGPEPMYWNNFVFEAYSKHRMEAVFLTGLPDVPESRPHSSLKFP